IQRPLFLPPSEVSKLPADVQLNQEAKALLDMINKIRVDDEKRAPLAIDPALWADAQTHASHRASGQKNKIPPLGSRYSGTLIQMGFKDIATPAELKELALALTK